MTEDDRLEAGLREYHRPGEMPRDRIWEAIERADPRAATAGAGSRSILRYAAAVGLLLLGGAGGYVLGARSAGDLPSSAAQERPATLIAWF